MGTLWIPFKGVPVPGLPTYRIYALGQSLLGGSNVNVEFDGSTETSTGDIDVALEEHPFSPGFFMPVTHEGGVYSMAAHIDFGGTVFPADVHGMISANDNGIADASTGQFAPGTDPIDMTSADLGALPYGFDVDGKITIGTPDGYFFLFTGPGVGHEATTILPTTYFEITKHA